MRPKALWLKLLCSVTWSDVDILTIVELIHLEGVNTLVDSYHRGGSSTGANWVSGWVRLQLDIFMVLHYVLFNIVLLVSHLLEVIGTWCWRPEWALSCVGRLLHLLRGCRVLCLWERIVHLVFRWRASSSRTSLACLLQQLHQQRWLVLFLLLGGGEAWLFSEVFLWDLVLLSLHGDFRHIDW